MLTVDCKENKNRDDTDSSDSPSLLDLTYRFTYYSLYGTAGLGVAVLVSNRFQYDQRLAVVLSIDSIVNLIAGFMYSEMRKPLLVERRDPIVLRYTDWFLTTPLLLWSLVVYFDYRNRPNATTLDIDYQPLIVAVFLNLLMLWFGLLGELSKKPQDRIYYNVAGFVCFVLLFAVIYRYYVQPPSAPIFWLFVFVWAMYGFAYFLSGTPKNVVYNLLDWVAKVGFGLFVSYEAITYTLEPKT